MQQPLSEKVVLVVSGEGEEALLLALELANKGADVAITGIDAGLDTVRETKKRIESIGRRCVILRTDPRALQMAVKETVMSYGRIDVFIDCSLGTCKHEKEGETPRYAREAPVTILANVEMLTAAIRYMITGEQLAGDNKKNYVWPQTD